MEDYKRTLIVGRTSSNAFNSTPYSDAKNRLKAIFCSCAKKLGEKCRQRSDNLSASDKALWLKANAVDMAFASQETSLDTAPAERLDLGECS